MLDFKDLEALAQQNIEWMPTAVTSGQKRQYQDASPEEILDLLEGVRESFALLASKLPPRLQQSARQEIEFFTALYQQRLAQVTIR